MMLYDIYKNHALIASTTGEYTQEILTSYVDHFYAKYMKYKTTSANALLHALQNRNNATLATNTFPQIKPNSKPK